MMDPALAFAHTGVSLNAELDMVRLEMKRGAVRVAVTGNGVSFDDNVDSDGTVRSACDKWIPKLRGHVTSCRILRESITDLDVSFRSLGYGPGSSVRLHLQVSELMDVTCDAVPTVVEEKPLGPPPAPVAAAAAAPREEEVVVAKDVTEKMAVLKVAVARLSGEDVCARTLEKYISAVLGTPREPRFRSIPKTNAAFQAKVARVSGGVDVLKAVGFQDSTSPATGQAMLTLELDAVDPELLRCALKELAEKVPAPAPPQVFDAFRSSRVDMTGGRGARSRARPESDAERELRALKHRRSVALASHPKIPDREIRLVTAAPQITDSGGPSDGALVRAAAAQQQRLARQRENAPLTTAASRDLDALKKKPLYAAARLKLTISSTVAIAATFGVDEPLSSVVALLNTVLVDPPSIRLFTSPPPTTLDPNTTIAEFGFAPAAVVRVEADGPLTLQTGIPTQDDVAYPIPILQGQDPKQIGGAGSSSSSQHQQQQQQQQPRSQGGRGSGRGGAFAWLKTG